MFAALHSDINPLKFGFCYFTGQPDSPKGRVAKVKDVPIAKKLILRDFSVDKFTVSVILLNIVMQSAIILRVIMLFLVLKCFQVFNFFYRSGY